MQELGTEGLICKKNQEALVAFDPIRSARTGRDPQLRKSTHRPTAIQVLVDGAIIVRGRLAVIGALPPEPDGQNTHRAFQAGFTSPDRARRTQPVT